MIQRYFAAQKTWHSKNHINNTKWNLEWDHRTRHYARKSLRPYLSRYPHNPCNRPSKKAYAIHRNKMHQLRPTINGFEKYDRRRTTTLMNRLEKISKTTITSHPLIHHQNQGADAHHRWDPDRIGIIKKRITNMEIDSKDHTNVIKTRLPAD